MLVFYYLSQHIHKCSWKEIHLQQFWNYSTNLDKILQGPSILKKDLKPSLDPDSSQMAQLANI